MKAAHSMLPASLVACAAALLTNPVLAGFYSTDQTVFDAGGGITASEHYSAATSVGIGFFGDTAEAPSGDVATAGFVGAFNEAPAAQPDSFVRQPGQPVTIQISTLLANDHDFEGDPVSLVGVSASSALGVPILFQTTSLVYNSTSQQFGIDSFTYSVTDGIGGTSEGTVFLTTGGPVLAVQRLSDNVRITFMGVAGTSYQIQRSDTLAPAAWQSAGNIIAASDGSVVFNDSFISGASSRYYRALQP